MHIGQVLASNLSSGTIFMSDPTPALEFSSSAPSVDSAEIGFSRGKLKITVERESSKSIYPIGYSFNGQVLRRPYLEVGEAEKGGVLTFRLSDVPASTAFPVPGWL
jgi:putative alpha-1,2-mannosidase